MGTQIRPEVSKKNRYWIERHRYYELKHFVMQYPKWEKFIETIDGYSKQPELGLIFSNSTGDPTERAAEAREHYSNLISMVDKAARKTDPVIGLIIFEAVVKGLSYEVIKARIEIPCCKDTYYDLYRRFFWLLHQLRK